MIALIMRKYVGCRDAQVNKERCQHKVLNLGRLVFAQITIFLLK